MELSELEAQRKNARRAIFLNAAVFVPGSFLCPSAPGIILCVAGVILFLLVTRTKMEKYKKEFKENIVRSSLSGVFDQLGYTPNEGVAREEVLESGLVELRDEFASNDLITARYGKVAFRQADIAITDKRRSAGRNGSEEVTHTCFTGRFLVFRFHKPVEKPVRVLGKGYNPLGNGQTVLDALKVKLTGSEHPILLESEAFNAGFSVFSEAELAVFYILTPPLIEAITRLSDAFEGKVALSFTQEKMYVAIGSKRDSLEPSLLSSRTVWEEKDRVLKDIKMITDFIDLMSLETNTLVASP